VKSGKIHLKRAYDQVSPDDGYRILVERLWPRGLTKEKADVDLWLKEIAPSPELRKWFGHDPQKWQEFSRRYRAELEENTEAVSQLRQILKQEDKVTFVYAARDTQHNSALLLKDYLEKSD
jgi:uncharacterized protein YeaO (DUF488 family)